MGLKYVPSSANFVLVNVGDGGEVFRRLMKKGIIVRSMVSYHLPAYIRVSIGTPEQNAKFFAELPGALEGLVQFNHVDLSIGGTGSCPSADDQTTSATTTSTDGQEPVPPTSQPS